MCGDGGRSFRVEIIVVPLGLQKDATLFCQAMQRSHSGYNSTNVLSVIGWRALGSRACRWMTWFLASVQLRRFYCRQHWPLGLESCGLEMTPCLVWNDIWSSVILVRPLGTTPVHEFVVRYARGLSDREWFCRPDTLNKHEASEHLTLAASVVGRLLKHVSVRMAFFRTHTDRRVSQKQSWPCLWDEVLPPNGRKTSWVEEYRYLANSSEVVSVHGKEKEPRSVMTFRWW